jgi:hypothetical protein
MTFRSIFVTAKLKTSCRKERGRIDDTINDQRLN